LWIEVHHQSSQAFCEGGRGKPKSDRGLAHTPLEGTDAEYMHE